MTTTQTHEITTHSTPAGIAWTWHATCTCGWASEDYRIEHNGWEDEPALLVLKGECDEHAAIDAMIETMREVA